MRTLKQLWIVALVVGMSATQKISADVQFEQILNAADAPHNWLTYNGTYNSQRHSALTQITPANVAGRSQVASSWARFQAATSN